MRNLENLKTKVNPYLIENIAQNMYLEDFEHLERLKSFGKNLCERTLVEKRIYIKQIIKDFGNQDISKLQVRDIEKLLLEDKSHSGSWKNSYLECFGAIYEETKWVCPHAIEKPHFTKFSRNSQKTDIFNTDELNRFFDRKLWDNERDYLIFKIIFSCGLRIGEARAIKINQFHFDDNLILINGFCKKDGTRTNYNKCGSLKEKKWRTCPLSNEVIKLTQEYIQAHSKKETDFLITQEINNKLLSQEYLEKVFKNVLVKAKINFKERKLCPHSLRFTFVTRMRRTEDAETVRQLVGHNSVEMTDYYTRFGYEDFKIAQKNTFEAVENLYN